MHISQCYGVGRLGLSFELFPPKTAAGEQDLFAQLEHLMAFCPSFVTCTYGAGGSTRDKTLDVVTETHRRHGVTVAAHLTCVGSTVDQLRHFLREATERGVENVVALRGDPPRGTDRFEPVAGGLRYANELVALIRREFAHLGVAVAGYPETHQEAECPEADLENLKRKVDAGADVVITQLFYDNTDYFRFYDRCRWAGIDVPIVPGILPITNLAQVQRITSLCKARLPDELTANLERHGDDPEAQVRIGVEFATAQVQGLIDGGVAGIHFYVLNKSHATSSILRHVRRP